VLTLCWFEAIWTFVPANVVIETARAENIIKKIMATTRTTPRCFKRVISWRDNIFSPVGKSI
jgi:hypothetical protein